jgi:hypothetical protein
MRFGSWMAWTTALAIAASACIVEERGGDDDGETTGSDDPSSSGAGASGQDGATSTTGAGAQSGQGGSGSGASGTGGSVGAGDPEACGFCIEEVTGLGGECHELDELCADNDVCDGWRACIEACGFEFQASCFDGCDELYAPAAAMWGPLKDCTCGACGSECAPGCS